MALPSSDGQFDLQDTCSDYFDAAHQRARSDRAESHCRCGKYVVDPEHCLVLFNSDDVADERHAVGACQT